MKAIDIFPWDDNFNTGLPQVDEQHRKLVKLLNSLASHVAFHSDIPALQAIIDELADYAVYHFETEETVWRAYFPGNRLESEHQAAHASFVETVRRFRQAEQAQPTERMLEEILAFLARWLATHILESDRRLAMAVLAMQSGLPLDAAIREADEKMRGGSRVLINIIISIYDRLASNTLLLMREIDAHLRDAESLKMFSLAVEQSPSSIVMTDLDANICYVNRAFTEVTGYAPDEAIGQNPRLLHSGKTPPSTYKTMWEALLRGEIWKGEFINLRKDGTEYIESALVAPVRQGDGWISHYLAIKDDITLHKQLEQQMAEQLSFTQAIIDAEVNGIAVCHAIEQAPYVRFTIWNPSMESLTGYTREEINHLGWYQTVYVDPEVRERGRERMERMRQGEHLQGEEWTITRKDGTHRCIQISTVTCLDDDRGPHVLAVMHDITERRQAERKLRALSSYTRSLIEASVDPLFTVSTSGIIMDVNRAAERITGCPREQLIGGECTQYATDPAQVLVGLGKVIAEGTITDFPLSIRHVDGHATDVLFNASVYRNEAGEVAGVFAAARDMTQRRKLEQDLRESREFLQRLLDSMAEGLYVIDPGGVCSFVNRAFLRLLGYASTEEVVGRFMHELIHFRHPDGRSYPANECPIIQALSHLQPSHSAEEVFWRKDGSPMPVEYWSYPVVKDSETFGAIVTFLDITERKQAERDIRQSQSMALAASRAKSEFLANMSHEIRTPMNAILGLTQLLEQDQLTPEQRNILHMVAEAGQGLLGILNDILDLSKIEAGQMKLVAEDFSLSALFRQLSALLEISARNKGLTLVLSGLESCPDALRGDGLRLKQILLNLAGNAIKFTERGQVEIRVTPLAVSDDMASLRFEVRDTGIGIAPATLGRLFQPFIQAEAGTTRRYGGTGLGLSISKRLVELMGGAIGATSTPNVGSNFWFALPFELGAAPQTPIAALPDAAPVPQAGVRLSGLRVLAVDDNRLNLFLVERVLQREGAIVQLAADGQQALQILRADPRGYDVVLMDIQMPVMDGLTATRAIRATDELAALPVIALTAGVMAEELEAAQDAGMTEFLTKPLDIEVMVTRLQRLVSAAGAPAAENPAAPPAGPGFPDIAGIDTALAARVTAQDPALFRRLLGLFAEEFADLPAKLRDDLAQGNLTTAARRVHTLRGSSGNLGAMALMQTAQALETALRQADSGPDRERLQERLCSQLADLIAACRSWLDTVATADSTAHAPRPDPKRLTDLLTALGRNNLAALDLYEELAPALAGELGAETARSLAHAMRHLRFEAALALLNRIAG